MMDAAALDAGQYRTHQAFMARCRPLLKRLEDTRQVKKRVYERRKKLSVPLGAVMTPLLGFIDYVLLQFQSGNENGFAGLTVLGFGALWWWVTKPKRDYAKAYKNKILPELAGLFGDFTYEAKGKIPMDAMKPSKIIPHHTEYKSEDHFVGEYKSVGITFSEIHLEKRAGKRTITVFKGLAVLLTHGTRKFHGHTILTKDQSAIGEWFQSKTKKLKRANLVDPEFERLFDVYTNDQVEARYLIDPKIIESLKALYEDYHGESLSVAFYDGHVLILIGSQANHFEPAAIDIPATDETELFAMKDEIAQILSIVDRLSLYDARKRRREEASKATAA